MFFTARPNKQHLFNLFPTVQSQTLLLNMLHTCGMVCLWDCYWYTALSQSVYLIAFIVCMFPWTKSSCSMWGVIWHHSLVYICLWTAEAKTLCVVLSLYLRSVGWKYSNVFLATFRNHATAHPLCLLGHLEDRTHSVKKNVSHSRATITWIFSQTST